MNTLTELTTSLPAERPTLTSNPLYGDVLVEVPLYAWGTRYAVSVGFNRHDPIGLTEVIVEPLLPVHALTRHLLLLEQAARLCAQHADRWQADDVPYADVWRQAAARLRYYRAGYEAAASEEREPLPFPARTAAS